jgi:hypothetical protein
MNSPRKHQFRLVKSACAAGCAALVMGAGTASADTATFDQGSSGWRSGGADCSLLGGGDLLCDAADERTAGGGNPGGALRSRTQVLANAAGLFTADHVWRSRSFTVAERPDEPAFGYDRRLDTGQLVALGVGAEVNAVLVDEDTGTETLLSEDALGEEDSTYSRRTAGVVPGALRKDGTYHVELRTTTRSTSTQAEVIGNADVYFDNVRLSGVSGRTVGDGDGSGGDGGGSGDGGNGGGDGSGGSGGDGNGGNGDGGGSGGGGDASSPGVTEPQPPASGDEFNVISDGSRPGALSGPGPGGSLIDRDDCTIVGTEGDDRIVGTKRHDVICALGGDDKIVGKAGHDVIDTGDGDDRASGGKKGDVLLGLAGYDRLKGGIGADKVGGGSGKDVLSGGKHNDDISAADKTRDRVNGGSGKRDRAKVDRSDKVKKVQRKRG